MFCVLWIPRRSGENMFVELMNIMGSKNILILSFFLPEAPIQAVPMYNLDIHPNVEILSQTF